MKIAIDEKQYDIALEKTTPAASLEQAGRQLNITLTEWSATILVESENAPKV